MASHLLEMGKMYDNVLLIVRIHLLLLITSQYRSSQQDSLLDRYC